MPTGYTADIKDGISFNTFVLNCARAFGACITLRDDPGGGERIPDVIEPSQYHAGAAKQVRAELAALDAMTPAQCDAEAAKDFDRREGERQRVLAERARTRQSYEVMLAKVEAWVPPTPDHQGIKDFMRQQITESIAWDCCTKHYDTPEQPKTGAAWAAEQREYLLREIECHDQQQAAENARAASRTQWLRDLRQSLR